MVEAPRSLSLVSEACSLCSEKASRLCSFDFYYYARSSRV